MPGPNGSGGGTDRFPDVDIPATNDAGGGGAPENLRYIDEAYDQMLADDIPREGDEQQPEARQPATPQPQYPQPVRTQQPGQQARQPGQQPQPRQQPQPQTQPQAPQLTDEQRTTQQTERRAQEDPFGLQAELIQQQEDKYVEALAKNVYPISNEDMDAFLSGDGTKVSQALARVHLNAVGSVMRVVSQQMPVWIGHMLKIRDTAVDAENGFWNANPGLNKREHREAANKIAVAYRQMNPQVTTEDMYAAVGAMVAAMYKIDAGTARRPDIRGNGNGQQIPRTPGRVVRRTPSAYSPSGAQPGGQLPPKIDNPWEQTTSILLADQDGLLDNAR